MHTSWSHDCSTDPAELVDHAEAEGLGAIAVTDHNVFGGALEAVDCARNRELIVIPGEEVKSDGQGEVIGLFLQREIPRGLGFAETIEAIREQDGIVYVPHPFDRMHAIPDPRTLHRNLADVDVFEVYNARLLFEGYNDEAMRFARKYNLTVGAGSDAHVLQGVGTGALRMRAFRDPEEFLISLRTAQVLRRPKSLQRLHVDPMAVYGTNCLKFADGDEQESRPFLVRELHIVQPKLVVVMGEDALRFVNELEFPLARELAPEPGELQQLTPTVEA